MSTWGNGRSSTITFVETVRGYFLFKASLSGTGVVSVRVRIYILTLYTHRPTSTLRKYGHVLREIDRASLVL